MAGKSARLGRSRGISIFGFDASGKDKDFHTSENARSDISLIYSGGTVNTPPDGYVYHTFTTPGALVCPPVSPSRVVDILVVGGGGGGGSYYGAGGGAGGIAVGLGITLTSGSIYSVGVGTGGQGGPTPINSYQGRPGENSYFGAPGTPIANQPDYILAEAGGGGGGGYYTSPPTYGFGLSGGSGGGSSGGDPSPASGQATQPGTNPSPLITDYGFPGGFSVPTGGYAPAGGGGAGAAGVSIPGNINGGGDGGAGISIPQFPHANIGLTFDPNYAFQLGPLALAGYGGGGGAGIFNAATNPNRNGKGGAGGGGYGQYSPGSPAPLSPLSTSGLDGTGSGGGGAKGNGTKASSGGNGIVVVRYLV